MIAKGVEGRAWKEGKEKAGRGEGEEGREKSRDRVDHGSGPSAGRVGPGRVTKTEKTSGSGRVMSF